MNDDRCQHIKTAPGQSLCSCMDYIMWLRFVIQIQAEYIADLERRMQHKPYKMVRFDEAEDSQDT